MISTIKQRDLFYILATRSVDVLCSNDTRKPNFRFCNATEDLNKQTDLNKQPLGVLIMFKYITSHFIKWLENVRPLIEIILFRHNTWCCLGRCILYSTTDDYHNLFHITGKVRFRLSSYSFHLMLRSNGRKNIMYNIGLLL